MKKQAYYLPNLNSLLMQNQSYLHHKQKLRESKSQYQIHHSCEPIQRGERNISQHLLVKMIPGKHQSSREVYDSCQADLFRVNKNYRLDLSTIHKRKLSQQIKQPFVHKVVNILSPKVGRYNKNNEESQQVLKERISKFIKEGTKVSYKFKKSLIEVEKRKKQRDNYYYNKSNAVRQEAKAQLQSIIERSIKMRKSKSPKDQQQYEIMQSPPSKPRQIGQRTNYQEGLPKLNHQRSISPINLNIVSKANAPEEPIRLKTQQDLPKKDSFLTKHRQLINKKILAYHLECLRFKQKQPRIDYEYKVNKKNCNINQIDQHSENTSKLNKSDMEIISIAPIIKQ